VAPITTITSSLLVIRVLLARTRPQTEGCSG
jgi:hypothetical protein